MKILHGHEMDWAESPRRGVWRKRFERIGPPESGVVTSFVRYDPGSRFHAHPHPEGEEILVVRGIFSDHTGDHGPGSYLLNPEGFEHAPHSDEGCEIFVRLRQYPGERPTVRLDTTDASWSPCRFDGVTRCTLYESDGLSTYLLRLEPGTRLPLIIAEDDETHFVVEGALEDERGVHPAQSYLHLEAGEGHTPRSPEGCVVYVAQRRPSMP